MADQATSLKMLLDWRRGLPRRREGCSRENLPLLPSSRSTAARSPAGRGSCRCCSYDIQKKDIGNTHLGGGRVAVGVLHVVVILRSCGTSYTSCSRCPRALQLRVRLVALRVAVEHIHIKDKLGQKCWQHYDIYIQPGPACSQIGSCSYPSWDLRKKKA